mgnify:CR=1 FL=1
MRKMLIGIAALVLCAVSLFADTTSTYTNQIGQVYTVTVTALGTYTTTFTPASQPASASQAFTFSPGIQIYTGATSNQQVYTQPRAVGDMFSWQYGSTNGLWVSYGVTSNTWQKLYFP